MHITLADKEILKDTIEAAEAVAKVLTMYKGDALRYVGDLRNFPHGMRKYITHDIKPMLEREVGSN